MKRLLVIFVILGVMLAQPAHAEENNKEDWEIGFGVTLASYHFNNGGGHVQGFNERNFGATAYFTDKGSIFPVIDEITISIVPKNSYGDPSVYFVAHTDIINTKHVDVALSAGIATGYTERFEMVKKYGAMPLIGMRMTIVNNVEIGVIPFGLLSKKEGVNILTVSYRF